MMAVDGSSRRYRPGNHLEAPIPAAGSARQSRQGTAMVAVALTLVR
jgi:hypothetical protein